MSRSPHPPREGPAGPPLRLALAAALLVASLATGCGPPPLEDFEQVLHVPALDVPGEPSDFSGIAYRADTDTLFVVDNKAEDLYEFDRSGRLLRVIEGRGFDDIEGIAHLGGDRFALVEEKRVRIALVELPSGAGPLERSAARLIAPERGTGPEGIAWDPGRELFFVVNEKKPMEVHVVDHTGRTEHLKAVTRAVAPHVTDLAGVHFSPARGGRLQLLSQESNRLLEVTPAGKVLAVLDLPGTWIEGITFTPDGREFFVVGEPRELFHYRAPPRRWWER